MSDSTPSHPTPSMGSILSSLTSSAPAPTEREQRPIVLASRASQLAQIQTNIVRDALAASHPHLTFETSFMSTAGDKNQSQALYLMGGKALWTKELEVALLEGDVDMLVHSLKDVPTSLPEGCELGAIMEREDPADSLVVKEGLPYKTLDDFPDGSVVGTSSVRRVAQLKRKYPHLVFQDVRGNLNTRLAKLDSPTSPYTGIILAKAGLLRMDWGHRISSDVVPPTLFHAVGQAALGVEIRSADTELAELLRGITHPSTDLRCRAERAFLRILEGGCSVPVGVATAFENGKLNFTGTVTSLNGDRHVEKSVEREVSTREDAERLGREVAESVIEGGGKDILDDVNADRAAKTLAQSIPVEGVENMATA